MTSQFLSPVPLIRPGPLGCLDLQIESLRDEANDRGLGVLAQMLDCAVIEVHHLAEQHGSANRENRADPSNLRRRVP
jgi:hypothetical protein